MREYRGDFEVHITVRAANQAQLDQFRAWCRARQCKCVRIMLARGAHVEQPMATWRRRATTLFLVLAEAHQYAAELERASMPVARVKVEADPHNDDVPQFDADAAAHDANNYFEHHVKLLRDVSALQEPLLKAALKYGAHLSRNAWREPAHGQEERFVTLRSCRVGRDTSLRELQQLHASLTELGEHIVEIDSEYCVYDSNLDLDSGWLASAN